MAWYSEESTSTLRRRAAEQVGTVLGGGVPQFLVNEAVREDGGESEDETENGDKTETENGDD